ncbi:MAG: bifunctional aspartate kinase/homoserine dehydrogenase I, partial [Candidatus Marinimicrobia bacterium]|nr:bifunctional aspartate kinase/homoserine dehydrogenase I [Candidatus Neomarinimicrobiota bacterium]
MKVLKFGGSSIATPERLKHVLELIKQAEAESQIAVVVSAFGGVTDQLIGMIKQAEKGQDIYLNDYKIFVDKHAEMLKSVSSGHRQIELLENITSYTTRLGEILRGIFLVRHVAPKTYNQVLSYGERLSARIITSGLLELGGEAEFIDARKLIRTDDNYGNGIVDFEISTQNI